MIIFINLYRKTRPFCPSVPKQISNTKVLKLEKSSGQIWWTGQTHVISDNWTTQKSCPMMVVHQKISIKSKENVYWDN